LPFTAELKGMKIPLEIVFLQFRFIEHFAALWLPPQCATVYANILLIFSLHQKFYNFFLPSSHDGNDLRWKGGNAWTSAVSDFQQYLIIDLGVTRNITRIAIQGRPHHSEYVSEFSVSYGYNGLDYADFKEPGGNTKVKKRMENDSKLTQQ
jgi:hypothetical protein